MLLDPSYGDTHAYSVPIFYQDEWKIPVNLGQTAQFSVSATGGAPLSYQWRKNGSDISGATQASYTTPPTTADDNGALFSVVVTNGGGSVTSNNATSP